MDSLHFDPFRKSPQLRSNSTEGLVSFGVFEGTFGSRSEKNGIPVCARGDASVPKPDATGDDSEAP